VNINIANYLFTDGGSAFLNYDGSAIIKENVPPVPINSLSTVKLIMPHMVSTSTVIEEAASIVPMQPLFVEAITRTADIYADLCRVDISYRMFPNIALAIQDKIQVRIDDIYSDCMYTNTDHVNGFGTCRFTNTQCSALFNFPAISNQPIETSISIAVEHTGTGNKVESSPILVMLHPARVASTAANTNTLMRATVPRTQIKHTDAFVMDIKANTDGSVMAAWAIDLIYNASALSYVSTTTHGGFSDAVVTSQILTASAYGENTGMVSITAIKLVTETDPTLFNGPDILLSSVIFDVLPESVSGTLIYSAMNRFMTNLGKEPIIEQQSITIDDAATTPSVGLAYILLDKLPAVIQLISVATPRHVVLKPDGTIIPCKITGFLVYDGFGEINTAVDSNTLECTTTETGIAVTTSTLCDSISPTGNIYSLNNMINYTSIFTIFHGHVYISIV
jgi:hypothetical protein